MSSQDSILLSFKVSYSRRGNLISMISMRIRFSSVKPQIKQFLQTENQNAFSSLTGGSRQCRLYLFHPSKISDILTNTNFVIIYSSRRVEKHLAFTELSCNNLFSFHNFKYTVHLTFHNLKIKEYLCGGVFFSYVFQGFKRAWTKSIVKLKSLFYLYN